MIDQSEITWKQTCVIDMGGASVAIMACEHGESYTRGEWSALSVQERDEAKARHDHFHRLGRCI